ncbi:uncharacterized protein [Palaemon carinicauda]|uniref:uncharacterized protein n=1 Tax=Palaemon carinicauda TaxID=392227 RepID=UPI0035B6392C
MFKKNLKWASESDLLIFRQPKGLLSTNFLSSTLPLQQPRSLPPLPVTSASFATQTSKESPIVIRHIHEFKLSPSPTNEDSGCCRTSPSSCEGCDDNGCVEDHSPDYVGTLDSGVSGVYSNTLESGLSGVYRCLSPVIPSIVEECTTHHMSDIIPALGGQRSNSPPVMHHSHPAHTSCLHCCFQNSSQDMNKEMGSSGAPNVRVSSPCPPRPHTVCSYSPPYKYSHTTSPISTTPLPNIHVSPSVSPLPNTPIVPLSFCLPSTVVEVSAIQASPGILSCNKTSETLMTSCSLPPVCATSLTSLTYVTSPTSVSLSQTRKTCPTYSRPLIPPDSPTPHNSPRLPNSINATRSRATKSPPITRALVTEVASDPVDLPITKTILVSNSVTNSKDPVKLENAAPNQNKNCLVNNNTFSSPTVDKVPEKLNKVQKENSTSNSTDASTPTSGRSKLEPHKPLHLNMKLPALLRKTYVQDNNKKEDPVKALPSSSLLQPSHSTTKLWKEEKPQPVTKISKNIDEKEGTGVIGTANAHSVSSINKPLVNGYKSDVSYSQYPRKYSPLWRANTPLLSSTPSTNNSSSNNPLTNGISSPSGSTSSPNNKSSTSNPFTNGISSPSGSTPSPNNKSFTSSPLTNGISSPSGSTLSPNNKSSTSSPLTKGISSPSGSTSSPNNKSSTSSLLTKGISSPSGSTSSPNNKSSTSSLLTKGISSPCGSTSSPNNKSSTSSVSFPTYSSPLVIKNDYTLKSNKNSPIISKQGKVNTLQSKGNNHVKFRDPVVSEAFQRNQDPVPSNYSPASPRERMLSHTSKVNLNKSESPATTTKKNQNGVTLMSDTLFTHFVVSNSLPYRFERDRASATDTDTDLETLERRLTLGMYAAPLVSSESCTSFSPDDGEEDPSATDYCTDAEDYNPHQYKAFSEENNPDKSSSQALLLSKARSKRRNRKFPNVKALDAAALVNTYSFFRKQTKTKKQRKNSFKELTPTAVSGGIVKPKTKTAKHMVAETFNAMFTLCTP